MEDPENPWIFFATGKIPWKPLKLHSTAEKYCPEADFPCINFWPCSAAIFFTPVAQWRRTYKGKTAYHVSCSKQLLLPTTDTKFQVKRRMKDGWVQAEDLYMIIIFFEIIVKNTLESP